MVRLYKARLADHGASPIEEMKLAAAGLLPWHVGAAIHRRLDGDAGRCFHRGFLSGIDTSLSPAERAVRRAGLPPPRRLGTMLSAQTKATNLPMLLHFEDRSSMAHGIEARVPFLDHPLVEFAIALGDAHKIEGTETKLLLRRAMGDLLPSSISERKDKIGFATPERRWFTGCMQRMLLSEMQELPRRFPGMFDVAALARLAGDVCSGRRTLEGLGWRLACLSAWSRVHGVSQ